MENEKVQVSAEDRARVQLLHKMIGQMEAEIASILGPYAKIKHPKLAYVKPSADGNVKHGERSLAGNIQDIVFGPDGSCGIYEDPPGICRPCH